MMTWEDRQRIVYGIMSMLRKSELNREDQALIMRLVHDELDKEDEDGNE